MRVVSEERLRESLAGFAAGEPRVVASGNFATPHVLLAALEREVERYRLFMLAAQGTLPDREGVIFETPFVGPGMRDAGARLDYLPMRLSLVPRLFDTLRPPDVVLLHTSLPRDGKVSLGIEVNILPAAVERVRARGGLVVAQLNPEMPYTLGDGELAEDLVDLGVEVHEELPSAPASASDEHARAIAERVADLVRDGSTLQLGIGQVPDATLRALSARRRLAVWSEMISDGVMALERKGALERQRTIVSSFMFGSHELYEWAAGNSRLRMARTETTNDPARIAAQPRMTSVNTALQVDLHDQAGASHVGGRTYSGFGGQPDFVSGALHSPGGQAVIALRSWHDRSDTSTIVPRLEVPVTSFQHSAVITEHGAAHIFGRSQRAQARLMIEHAAHPDAREQLREYAAPTRA
ncbi:MAG TPA: acetyl-CoA hydrolase/transferase C-terminal domain-containing protein [Solirubrobacteraceae bacterium]|jgi:acyl-CoA hydrolase|nr:acetyl-CoA hydrolase/transferase C-terminal domain-containing protein [Solirubrobacteraceae bacterium]